MRVTAVLAALDFEMHPEARWSSPFAGKTVLEQVAANVLACPVIMDACIASDDPELLERGTYGGLPVRAVPSSMRRYLFNPLSLTLNHISMERSLHQAVGMTGDIVAHVPWSMPLLDAGCLERLYHVLLEDPLPARITPITPEDPALFTRFPGQKGFFPVWHAPSMDRQRVPQLYRSVPISVNHMPRMRVGIPLVKGLPLDPSKLVRIQGPEDLDLARYLFERQPSGTPS